MYNYKIVNKKYSLYNNDKLIFKEQEEISVLFSEEDKDSYILHKHGVSENVLEYFNKNMHFFNIIGSNLVVYTGKFPLEELNKLISCTGYANEFVRKLKNKEMDSIEGF